MVETSLHKMQDLYHLSTKELVLLYDLLCNKKHMHAEQNSNNFFSLAN